MENYFEELNKINVNEKVEKKNGLSYLSWAYAWGELKKKHPTAEYTVYENKDGWNYFTDGKTCWVKTGVSVMVDEGYVEHIEYLPVMDYRNKSIPADAVTSFDVNKAIQRSLTKAVARHGLGLYIYAGEDLPEESGASEQVEMVKKVFPGVKVINDTPIEDRIMNCTSLEELGNLYKENKAEVEANTSIRNLIAKKGKSLEGVA